LRVVRIAEVKRSEGKITYPYGVLQRIVAFLALKVPGVEALDRGVEEGVRLEISRGLVNIRLYLILKLERRVPEIAWQLQKFLKNSVEEKTGLRVGSIDVYIQDFTEIVI
jgi:uncharacterized alkaline shock family protein YloU